MAAREYLKGMGDPFLKPRLLRSLLRDRLPDEKRPSPGPAELGAVLEHVKTHELLSERVPPDADQKLVEAWRFAVDAWVDRLLSLVSSPMPDKCWAGTCLLGVTCEECSSDRFLASYSLWSQKLFANIQPPSSSHFVKVASCASLADIFTRLAGFTNTKKDASSLAGKLIQPVLKLLSEDVTEAVWEGAADLLSTIMTLFPPSVHRHYDNTEAVLASKIMSGKCNTQVSTKLACCLALLPRAKGDEDSWSLMIQKVLILINRLLNDAFEGVEEEDKGSEVMRLLVAPGKDCPPPLGGHLFGEAPELASKKLRDLLASKVSAMMQCCCMMLTNPYTIEVAVPIRPLLALIGRVLLLDASFRDDSLLFSTALHQELLCSELPALHLDSLDLLIAVIKGVKSQLTPHGANIVRLLTKYFRKATLPSARIKVYSIMQMLLISMGVGMALYLTQEVIDNAFVDLADYAGSESFSSGKKSSEQGDAMRHGNRRKRKHASGSIGEIPDGVSVEIEVVGRKPTTLSVKIAALRALEALLTVGGSLRSECWRPNVDLLLITVATNACKVGWSNEHKSPILVEESTSLAELQFAALQALLASLLSPAHVRPPYLSQGLELFRRGKQEAGTRLAPFCAHALLALEVLIHPRALPFVDLPVAKISTLDEGTNSLYPVSKFNYGLNPNMSFSRGDPRAINFLEDDDEELFESLLRDDEEPVADGSNTFKHGGDGEQPVKDSTNDSGSGKHVVVDSDRDHEIAVGTHGLNNATCLGRDEIMVDMNNAEVPNSTTDVQASVDTDEMSSHDGRMASVDSSGNEITANREDSKLSENSPADTFGNDVQASVDTDELSSGDGRMASVDSSGNEIAANRKDSKLSENSLAVTFGNNSLPGSNALRREQDENISLDVSGSGKDKMVLVLSDDSDSESLNSLPDIVDADPESD